MSNKAIELEYITSEINRLVKNTNNNEELLKKICEVIESNLDIEIYIYDKNNSKDYYKNHSSNYPKVLLFENFGICLNVYNKSGIALDKIFLLNLESIIYLVIKNIKSYEENISKSYKDDVKNVLDKLSYSELMAIVKIFHNFDGSEKTIIASRLAKDNSLTRSSIVNAIRKLESAKIIESYSLGVKGTHIKILNNYFLKEVEKFK